MLSLVIVIITLSILVTRVATVALTLTLTGLSRESAKFQARSAFSGAGFTTTESEDVVNHPIRRRVIMSLMLIGNAGDSVIIYGRSFCLGELVKRKKGPQGERMRQEALARQAEAVAAQERMLRG